MADHQPHLDVQALSELEVARQEHVRMLREIPLSDKDLFAEACARYEARIESILHGAADRQRGANHMPSSGDGSGGRMNGEESLSS